VFVGVVIVGVLVVVVVVVDVVVVGGGGIDVGGLALLLWLRLWKLRCSYFAVVLVLVLVFGALDVCCLGAWKVCVATALEV
jgi:hypothetical protein